MAPNCTKIHSNLIKKLHDKVAGCIVCLWDASYSTVWPIFREHAYFERIALQRPCYKAYVAVFQKAKIIK